MVSIGQKKVIMRRPRPSLRCLTATGLALFILLGPPLLADDWPQFRGPNCSGISLSGQPLPTKFSPDENLLWQVELGDGIGSPTLVSGRVFVSAMLDEETVALLAFDAASGSPIWQRQWSTGPLPDHRTNSHASATPAADENRVYFYFSTLGMLCVDAVTGDDLWQTPLPIPYTVFKWGPGMSPVVYDDLVLFCQDDDLSPALFALDQRSGEIRWQDNRDDMCVNYSHPVICSHEGKDEIVVAGTGLLIGYDPHTGRRQWHARTLLRNIKTTPVVHDGVIYISLQSGGIAAQWIASIDQAETGNRDGRVTKEELQAFIGDVPVPEAFYQKTFDRGDLNGDGALEGEELDRAFLPSGNYAGASYRDADPAEEYILAVRGGGQGDVTNTHVLWKHATKHTDHIVSPLVSHDRMLLVKCGGIATCFDIKGGESLWGPQRIRNASDYFASPVRGDGKIYIAGENGVVVVLNDAPKLKVLATNDVGDSIVATPAISQGRFFVRTRSGLLCFGLAVASE